jgi:hypothetical protein
MNRPCLTLALAATLAVSATIVRAAEVDSVSLFDGKTLAGWTIKCKEKDKPTASNFWRVDEGTILADSMGHKDHDYVWLATDKEYADFTLQLKFQVGRDVKGNSGVQVRSRYDEKAGYLDGPQIDINPPGPWRTGMMWDETRGVNRWIYPDLPKGKWVDESMTPKDFKFFDADQEDGWNDMKIVARGLSVKAWLNGVQVTDLDGAKILDDEIHQKHNVGLEGVIALQIHSHDQVRIRFKDLRIQEH